MESAFDVCTEDLFNQVTTHPIFTNKIFSEKGLGTDQIRKEVFDRCPVSVPPEEMERNNLYIIYQ